MKILHISDTHGKHRELKQLPVADIIVHSGDFTFGGTENEVYDFLNWFLDLPYRYKIFIAGNHDDCLYGEHIEGLPSNVYYLCNSGIEIEDIKFYGIPMFMQDFMDDLYDSFFDKIPYDTDVLITHQPPMGICDLSDYGTGPTSHGNLSLLERVNKLHLHYHLFGHEHDAHGVSEQNSTVFSNAALVDNAYNLYDKPKLFEYR